MKPERDRRGVKPETFRVSENPKGLRNNSPALNWAIFVGRHLLFIAAVAFAIVYLCALGLRLAPNSTAIGRTSGLRQQLVPALEELFELLNASARKLDTKIARGLALRRHYQQVFSGKYTPRNGALVVTWGDPEPALENDTLEAIDPQYLSQAAEVINLTLIKAAHEPRY